MRRVVGPMRFGWLTVRHWRSAMGYLLRRSDEESLNLFNSAVFRGGDAHTIRELAAAFASDSMPQYLVPSALAHLHAHRAQGHRCVIVSRGFAWCIEPWARTLGITDVLATHLEVGADGRLTGRMSEPSCDREHKRTRLLHLLGDRAKWEVYAYGDSVGDWEMFGTADHAFVRKGGGFARWSG
jgi:phosphatidylglycerophosphatase C